MLALAAPAVLGQPQLLRVARSEAGQQPGPAAGESGCLGKTRSPQPPGQGSSSGHGFSCRNWNQIPVAGGRRFPRKSEAGPPCLLLLARHVGMCANRPELRAAPGAAQWCWRLGKLLPV